MATVNPFDLLGDDDNDDPTHLIVAQQKKIATATKKGAPAAGGAAPAAGKLPSKPLPPSQAVREARGNAGPPRGGGTGRGGPGRGRAGRGGGSFQDRDSVNENANGFGGNYGSGGGFGGGGSGGGGGEERPSDRERGPYSGPRQPFRSGPRRGGYGNADGEAGGDTERPRRTYERRSGTGRGYEVKRDGAGRGNWGSATDDAFQQETEENVNTDEKVASPEKDAPPTETGKENKEGQENESEEKEDKEMTLEEYEKIREEKRKALLALKSEERKVEIDKELKSMQQLSLKKGNDEIFIKLGSDKEKKKENADRDERAKKSLSINEFLKPAEGEKYYNPGGRGRGRGRGDRGPVRGGFGAVASAPPIEDPGHFPTLGGK